MSDHNTAGGPHTWLLALESSTSHGGAALMADGEVVATARLDEGLRHGRELLPAAAALMRDKGVGAGDLQVVAVSAGPGSYTGTRVGVMAAKALAFATHGDLVSVSSLAAMAATARFQNNDETDVVMVVQDARRDEVYAGLYRISDAGDAVALAPDAAIAPEEAKARLNALLAEGVEPLLAGSGFITYKDLFRDCGIDKTAPDVVDPAAVAVLGWRQFLQANIADPFLLQPCYLRRDEGADWTKDHLIAAIK